MKRKALISEKNITPSALIGLLAQRLDIQYSPSEVLVKILEKLAGINVGDTLKQVDSTEQTYLTNWLKKLA